MITLSNGHSFEYMVASGALAYDGKGWPWEYPLRWLGFIDPSLFTIVIKTLTLKPRKGNLRWHNPLGCIRPIWENGKITGTVNSVGLTNPGIEWWCREIGPKLPKLKTQGIKLVASIFGNSEELVQMAEMLNPFELVGLEYNASCPNTEHDVFSNSQEVVQNCKLIVSVTRFPVLLKLSVSHKAEEIIKQVSEYAEAISINSVPWRVVFPAKKSPLEHLGQGGVSGKIAQPFMWEMIDRLNGVSNIPIIGPGVWEFDDIRKLREEFCVKAISFGSLFLPFPWRPTAFVKKDMLTQG